jgi:pimeloyl-ACP methyl ester carboxylesterase
MHVELEIHVPFLIFRLASAVGEYLEHHIWYARFAPYCFRAIDTSIWRMKIMRPYATLLASTLLSISAAITAHAEPAKTATPTKPTIVIVHGAFGGSWAFRRVDALLRDKGYNVFRPQLTGQGDRVHLARPDIGLSTHIEDVVNTILYEDLHDIILVGHSYGGMVITGVADRIPDRVKRLVYLDAWVPNDGESMIALIGVGPRRDELQAMIKGDYVVPSWVKPGQALPRDEPQSLKTFTDPIVLRNKVARGVPATYILTVKEGTKTEDDEFYGQSLRAKERGWPVLQLTSDHNAQWSAPEALVETLSRVE